jgi:uracil-DNA glycosylase
VSRTNPLSGRLGAHFDVAANDWQPLLQSWAESPPGRALQAAVDARVAAGAVVYPATPLRAFELTPLANVRAVILGQDPYHGPGQAEGLAFSVPAGQRTPPSLRNIFREMQRDLGLPPPATGALQAWTQRGVLLLNTSLTVEDGQAGSHARLGWQSLTAKVLRALVDDPAPKAFLLWGAHAQAQMEFVTPGAGPHAVLRCNHPSPLSALRPPAPFVGCGHFGQASRFLAAAGRGALDWSLAPSNLSGAVV